MKGFQNVNARSVEEAVAALQRARTDGRKAVLAGGGSDLLGMIKEQLVAPDVVINLKSIVGLSRVTSGRDGVTIGGLTTLSSVAADRLLQGPYAGLGEAAESVGTPQIRHTGTLAGNVCQRPWCWYFRNGFPCIKRGGDLCYAAVGEHQLHAIFGGGPSFIVHPSDTAPALLALDATFRIVGPSGARTVPAADFFVLPERDSSRENVLGPDDVLVDVHLPPAPADRRSTYVKILDREAWTHAVVSVAAVMDLTGGVCRRARIVLGGVAPIPWALPEVDRLLAGQRITPALAEQAATLAMKDATPLSKNAYKVPLARTVIRRTLLTLAGVTG